MSTQRRWRLGLGTTALLGVVGLALTQFAGRNNTIGGLGSAALIVALLAAIATILLALGPASGPDRDREARAREQFDRTGEWPGE